MKTKTVVMILIVGLLGFAAGKWGGELKPLLVKAKERMASSAAEVPVADVRPAPVKKITKNAFSFDDQAALAAWTLRDVEATISKTVPGAVELKFGSTEKAPAFYLENAFDRQSGDWSDFGLVRFNLTNRSSSEQRITLQIKDSSDARFKNDYHLAANETQTIDLYINELKAYLDVRKIRQFNLFRWNPTEPAELTLGALSFLAPEAVQARFAEEEAVPAEDIPINWWGRQFREKYQHFWEQYDMQTDEQIVRIPLNIVDETRVIRSAWPLTGGVPLPQGAVKSLDQLRVTNAEREEVPRQFKVTATWPDGSLKWVLVNLQADVTPAYRPTLFLEYRPKAFLPMAPELTLQPLTVNETDADITVTTGPMRLSVDKNNGQLLESVWLDADGDQSFAEGERVLLPSDGYVQFKGQRYRTSLDPESVEVTLEEQGPLRSVIKMSGWYANADGDQFCRHVTRLELFAGKSYARMYHTLIYTGFPANPHHFIHENIKLPDNEPIDAFGLDFHAQLDEDIAYYTADDQGLVFETLETPVALVQSTPNQVALFKPDAQTPVREGAVAEGWIDAADLQKGVSVYVREAWQQAPKAWRVQSNDAGAKITLDLWPAEAGPLDLKTNAEAYGPGAVARGSAYGLAKTHEIYLYFHPAAVQGPYLRQVAEAFDKNPVLLADPDWISTTGAIGFTASKNQNSMVFDAEVMLGNLFDWALRQPQSFQWYGMLDYGDTRLWYRRDAYDKSYSEWGWHPEGRWGWFNVEGVGLHTGLLLQFMRTGDIDYFRFADRNTKHIMDVDTVHYNTVANDRRLRKLPEDFSQVGSMHRHNADHWGGRNEETSHTHLLGLLWHYYLTGYARSMDVAHEVGGFVLKDKVTYFRHPDISPQRSVANALWCAIDMYAATHDPKYREAADKWARVLVRGQNSDGSWEETYNPVKQIWTGGPKTRFMALYTIPALITYHTYTGSPNAAEALVRGVDYLIKKERFLPYFDGLAYAYRLTGKDRYLAKARELLSFQIQSQQGSGQGILGGGMVFNKAIYDRVPPLLFSVPYGIGAFVDDWVFPQPESDAEDGPVPEGDAVPDAEGPTHSSIRKAGDLNAGVAVSLQRIFQDPDLLPVLQDRFAFESARNELESLQLVLWTEKDPAEVTVTWTGLNHVGSGAPLPAENLHGRLVGYVYTSPPAYEVERTGDWPDPLKPYANGQSFEIEPGKVQPLWLTLRVPEDAAAGLYKGVLRVSSGGKTIAFPMSATVWNFTLPQRPAYSTAFDFYPNRLKQAYERDWPHVAPQWRGRWEELTGQYFDLLLDYKMSPMVHVDPEDPADIAQINEYLQRGLTDFSVGLRGGHRGNNWPEDPVALQDLVPRYSRYAQLLRRENLLERAYVYTYDEPQELDGRVLAIADMIRSADPELRNLIVLQHEVDVDQYREWFEPMDIVCVRNVVLTDDMTRQIQSMGKTLWLYASGPKPPFPTFVVDYPATAYRIMPWMSWKIGAEGLLFWTTNFWRTNPWLETNNTEWDQNGNGVLLYPHDSGPVPSMRMALIRDGVEDYDYLALLQQAVEEASTAVDDGVYKRGQALLRVPPQIAQDLKTYTRNPWTVLNRRRQIAEAIEMLRASMN